MKIIGSIKRACVRALLANSFTRKIAHKIVYDPEFLGALPIDPELINRLFDERESLERFLCDERTESLIATTPRLLQQAGRILRLDQSPHNPLARPIRYAPPEPDAPVEMSETALTAKLLEELGPAGGLVSVIIPCYNYGQFVGEAVESVLRQTSANVEAIVVNDGSNDPRTIEVLNSLASDRVRVLNQENQGLSTARNNGAAIAKGDYLVFLDADDTLEPNAIALMLHQLKLDPEATVVYPAIKFFGEENMVWCPGEFNAYDLLWANHPSVCILIRRQDFEASDKYQPSMKYGYEDWEFNVGLSRRGKRARYLPVPVFNYRRHGRTMVAHAHGRKEYLHRELRRLNEPLYSIESIHRIKQQWRPLITIIIIADDDSTQVAQTLESIQAQTTDDIEVIILRKDSGDWDEFTNRHNIKNLRYESKHTAEAMNLGAREARGDFLLFVKPGSILPLQACELLSLKLLLQPLSAIARLKEFSEESFTMIRKKAFLHVGGFEASDTITSSEASLVRRLAEFGYLDDQRDSVVAESSSPEPVESEQSDSLIGKFQWLYYDLKYEQKYKYDGFRRQNVLNLFQKAYYDSSRINVLYLIPHMVVGGAESIDIDILTGLDPSRFRVILAVERESDHVWREKYWSAVDEMFLCQDFGGGAFGADRLLDHLFVSKNIDIVLNRNTHMGYRAIERWSRDQTEARFADLLHLHNFGADWVGIAAQYDNYLHRRYVTNQDLKQYESATYNLDTEKTKVVYCGIDVNRWDPEKVSPADIKENSVFTGKQIVGFVGRFDEQKNPLKWIEVAAELRRRRSEIGFVMIGDGPLIGKAKARASHLNLDSSLAFTGFRDDIPELMMQMDCLLLVSGHEGLPQVLLEAMSMGVPVVASDAGGTRESITPDVGRVVPIDASISAYADNVISMLDLIETEPERRKFIRNHIVQSFSVEKMQSIYAREFESMFAEVNRGKRLVDHQIRLMRASIFG